VTAHTVAVVKYTYHLFSSREDEDPVAIFLYDEKSDVVGEVFFVAEDKPLPPAQEAQGRVSLHFRRSQLMDVLDLLRNEGPITLRWAGPFDTSLSTEYEPIGEGEGGRKRQRRQP
jgi:hypothetical protein